MRFEEHSFRNETVVLDNNEFYNCEFVDVTLQYSGGPVVLEGPVFRGFKFKLEGPAMDTIVLLRSFIQMGGAETKKNILAFFDRPAEVRDVHIG